METGIPIPKVKGNGGAPRKYQLGSMEIGESFLVETNDIKLVRSRMSAAYRYYRPKRFTGRTVEGGFRVWRVA